MKTTSPPRSASSLLLSFALCGVFASAAAAQPFEEVFGPRDAADRGERRVTPVVHCPDRGFVAVGTTVGPNQTMVYLVKTDPFGVMQWERTYDVGNDGRPDEGFSLVELPHAQGYAITGTSNRGTISPLFLMRVDCNGKGPVSAFYTPPGLSGLRVVGRDIIQAQSGNPSLGTNPGDFVIAGYVENTSATSPALGYDAFLLRVREAFPHGIIWQRRYNYDVNEKLFALTEASVTTSATPTGDIVAVGEYVDSTSTSQALIQRVNGDNGNFTGGAQCAALYGGQRREAFYSVVELQKEWPNLAMVGFSTTPGLRNDVYLVKTRDNPCVMVHQSVIGNEDGLGYDEIGYDLKEILQPMDPSTGTVVGDLAITGYAEWGGVRRDATLLYAEINFLTPLTARVYGDHDGNRVDEGRSLAQNYENGFVIAGFSESDFELNGDPRDLYLFSTTDYSKTGCEKEWKPIYDFPGWIERRVLPVATNVVNLQLPQTKDAEIKTAFPFCP